MNIKEWAGKLTGIEYPSYELNEAHDDLKADGIIAVYGSSDDLVEFRGIIGEEVGAYEGATVRIAVTENGELKVFDEDENQETAEFNKKQIANMAKVEAIWCPEEDGQVFASWLIQISDDIPHETFDIMEDGELFCRSILIHVDSIRKRSKPCDCPKCSEKNK